MDSASEPNSIGPDYFGYYTREVAELLSQAEDFLPCSSNNPEFVGNGGPQFCDGPGAGLSDIKKERLKLILRQSVGVLSREVDEMLDPAINLCRIKSRIMQIKSSSPHISATCEEDLEKHQRKKPKMRSSSSSRSHPLHASRDSCSPTRKGDREEGVVLTAPGKDITNGCDKECANCNKIDRSNNKTGPKGSKFLCNACAEQGNKSLSNMGQKASYLGSNVAAEQEEEVNDDLQILLENDGEESIMKHSHELSNTLGCMQQKLEELLDIVISSCRQMTHVEKHELCRLIKNLPPENLSRVAEILRPQDPLEKKSLEEIDVNLEHEDNTTLWRLYYYVQAFENVLSQGFIQLGICIVTLKYDGPKDEGEI